MKDLVIYVLASNILVHGDYHAMSKDVHEDTTKQALPFLETINSDIFVYMFILSIF